jgi:hypothetical protein
MRPVYALLLLPIFFTLAGIIWFRLDPETMTGLQEDRSKSKISDITTVESTPFLESVKRFFRAYFISVCLGAKLVFSSRKFAWLFCGYTIPLFLHRFLENVIFPTFAKNVLGNGAYSGILVSFSLPKSTVYNTMLAWWF